MHKFFCVGMTLVGLALGYIGFQKPEPVYVLRISMGYPLARELGREDCAREAAQLPIEIGATCVPEFQ